jgi:hypothetical protein
MRREKPSVLTIKATVVGRPAISLWMTAQSLCIWWPGSVSNRTVARLDAPGIGGKH